MFSIQCIFFSDRSSYFARSVAYSSANCAITGSRRAMSPNSFLRSNHWAIWMMISRSLLSGQLSLDGSQDSSLSTTSLTSITSKGSAPPSSSSSGPFLEALHSKVVIVEMSRLLGSSPPSWVCLGAPASPSKPQSGGAWEPPPQISASGSGVVWPAPSADATAVGVSLSPPWAIPVSWSPAWAVASSGAVTSPKGAVAAPVNHG